MPRILALEWSDTEARVAVASPRGELPVIEHAFAIALRPGSTKTDAPDAESDTGGQIAAALAVRGLGKLDTLVAVGRTNIELRRLSLPPAPDDELPELVRFQALKEFNALEEDWPLDFVAIEDAADEPRSVLAAAADPKLVDQIQRTCQSAGLKPRRLILRPCAAASLLRRFRAAEGSQVRLLVDLLSDEADLTVILDRKVVFLRTARLPGDPLVDVPTSQALVSEIRRTMAAAQNQLGGRPVESIVLCGSGPQHAALAERISDGFGTSTELFDPFGDVKLGSKLARALPDHPGRFAPLVGMLLDELEQAPHGIDFLHPRRRAEPPSRRNLYASVALAAGVLLAVFLAASFVYGKRLEKENVALGNRSHELDKQVQEAEQLRSAAAAIRGWTESDFFWLGELHKLAEKLPPPQEAMLTELGMRARLRQGEVQGEIEIKGLAQDIDVIERAEESLRDGSHQVVGNEATEERPGGRYAWRFSSSLFLRCEGP